MKNIESKLIMVILVLFSFTFFMNIDKSKAVYHEVESTTINLTIASDSDFEVTFDSRGGTSISSRYVHPNDPVGVLPIPTKTDYNFAGWYDTNNQRVTHQTVITADTPLHAVWTKIVCKRVTDESNLHKETCVSSGGCVTAGMSANDIITYGTVGDGVPISGDAYDCDVDADGTFNAKESDNKTFTERFYFVRSKTNSGSEDSAVMYYSTSFDANGRNNRSQSDNDIGSYGYDDALTHLPSATLWDNPDLLDVDGNGGVSRFATIDDIEAVCGTIVTKQVSYFRSCQKWFWFENTRFQSNTLGRSGIWLEKNNNTYYRIHAHSLYLDIPDKGASSENTTRPVMEIPMSALEGYYDEDRFTLSFNTYTGDPNPIDSVKRYRGEVIGVLPTPTRDDYTFENWYTDSGFQNVVDPTALVSGNMTLYANWVADTGVTITLHLNDGEISGVTSPITINSGETLSNLPDPTRTGYTFLGWYTNSTFETPFDKTQQITTDVDLYAKWEEVVTVTVTLYLNDGTITGVTSPITLNSGDLLDNLPDPTKTNMTFAGWYTDSNFETPFDDTVPITTDLNLYAKWIPADAVAEVNGQYYTTLSAAFGAVPTTGVKTRVTILKDITLTESITIPSSKYAELAGGSYTITSDLTTGVFINNGKLDIISGNIEYSGSGTSGGTAYIISNNTNGIATISGGYLKYNNSTATESKPIENKGGKVYITGGRIECNAKAAAINNKNSTGLLEVSGGEIIATNNVSKGQAIYIENGATANISGTAYIENVSITTGNDKRAAVDNNGGTLNITGGTVVSKGYIAVVSRNSGATTVIGVKEEPAEIDVTTPVLRGVVYGLERSNGTVKVYDGVFQSLNNSPAINGTISEKPNVEWVNTTMMVGPNVYNATYLGASEYTVEFYPENGESTITKTIASGTAIGSDMPNDPQKNGYYFGGWYDTNDEVVDSTTTVTFPIKAYAKWLRSVNNATVVPNPIIVKIGETAQINITDTDIENVTYSSSDTSVVTVSSSGLVTGVSSGQETITLTGEKSNLTYLVVVYVVDYHTVTINKNDGTSPITFQINDGDPLGTNLPTNLTRTDYIFDKWVLHNTSTVVDSTTPVNGDMIIDALWIEKLNIATISPSSIDILVGDDEQISVTATDSNNSVESVSYASGNPSVATVSATGLVTGVSAGTTTITITGSESNLTHSIEVTVSAAYEVTFDPDNNGANIIKHVSIGDTLESYIPTNVTNGNYVFDNWYLVQNDVMTTTEIDPSEVITGARTYKAKWAPSGTVCKINETGNYYTTVQLAINAAPQTKSTIKMLANVNDLKSTITTKSDTNKTKNLVLNLNNHTISYTNSKDPALEVYATMEIMNGTITSSAQAGAVNVESGGHLIVNSGTISNSNNRQAVYNNGGTVEIGGTANLTAKTNGAYNGVGRGAITNVSGSLTITGGNIINTDGSALVVNAGTVTIGTEDSTIDITSPVFQGYSTTANINAYGLEIKTGTVNVYDGIFMGKADGINTPTSVNHPNNTLFDTDDTDVIDGKTYKLAYLVSDGPTPTPTPAPSTYTITFESMGGTVSPASTTIIQGEPITSSDLPTTATWGDKTLAGWYVDEDYTTAVVPGTTIPTGNTTYYAKWTYTGTMTNFNSTNDAMATYFSNISSWKNLSESDFISQMSSNFTTNNCSACEAENTCNNPGSGNHCDKPKVYDTNTSSALDVYLYDESSNTIMEKIEYTNSSSGTITNLIPEQAYYWEKSSDPTINGLIKATTPRRTLSVGNIRNVRDLGGLSVSYMENNVSKTGTIKYGKLLRGAKLSSSQSDVTALTNLGITREIDLRPNSEGSGQARMNSYDNDGGTDINIQNYLINHTAYTYSYSHSGNNYTEVAEHSSYASTFKTALKSVMQYVVNGDNIYFHCTIGTDRTGTMAYFLEGLLGVSEEDRLRDYDLSYYFGLVVNLGARTRYHDDLTSTNTYPRFKFMHTAYPTNQDIYAWFTYGDNAEELAADNALITSFRNSMIDFN